MVRPFLQEAFFPSPGGFWLWEMTHLQVMGSPMLSLCLLSLENFLNGMFSHSLGSCPSWLTGPGLRCHPRLAAHNASEVEVYPWLPPFLNPVLPETTIRPRPQREATTKFLGNLSLSSQWLQISLPGSPGALFPHKSLYKVQVSDFSASFGGGVPQVTHIHSIELCPRPIPA